MDFFTGNELQTTEPQFSSKFVILAVHYLIDAYMLSDSHDQTYLWKAVKMLKEAAKDSPLDSQLLMVTMRIYQHLGLVISCTELMDKMQIKQFLLQTAGWVMFNRLGNCGAFEESKLLHSTLIKYIQSSSQTVPDFVIQAYRNGVYRKIVDMLQWKHSLFKSYAFIHCVVEEMALDVLQIGKLQQVSLRAFNVVGLLLYHKPSIFSSGH